MRLRKQKEVQKENEFYMQLLQQALPPEQQMLQRQEREAEEGKFFLLVFSVPCCSQRKRSPDVLRSCWVWWECAELRNEISLGWLMWQEK